jgi:5-oxopent-3-ene-1,2,5-tricarboxylate decarboxylase / 2-hydroxyhepta-2,4-diene-1,7-dioate isomerase
MKVAQFEDEFGYFVGVKQGSQWINYTKASAAYYLLERDIGVISRATIDGMIERGLFHPAEMAQVVRFVTRHRLQRLVQVPADAQLRAPLRRPRKIVALGLNYVLHAKEGSFQVPKEPVIFMKAGSSVIGPEEIVRIPRGLGRMDHEVELAVVIGRTAKEVRKKAAYDYIAGYTICNDISARDLQTKDINNRHPWFRTKSFDTFTPIGPWLVTTDEIRRPVHLNLECRVNGTLRQKSNTRHLVFDIPTIIEFISRYITLEAGDIISTGTPSGIGPIKHGDVVVCRIQGIGELRNEVRNR